MTTFDQEMAALRDSLVSDAQDDGLLVARDRVAIRTYTYTGANEGQHVAGTESISDAELDPRPTLRPAGRGLVEAMRIAAGTLQGGSVIIEGIPASVVTLTQMRNLQAHRPTEGKAYVWWASREADWVASTAYLVGDRVIPTAHNGRLYVCTVAGTSGSVAPSWPTGQAATVTDGTCTWVESGPDGVEYIQKNWDQPPQVGAPWKAEAMRSTESA